MRSSVHSSQLKESLLEVFKQSTQASEHKFEDLEDKLQFYHRFYQNKKLQLCQISQIEIVRSSFWRSYAVYTIKIMTCDLEYCVKRRFSDFEQFYYKNKVDRYLDVKLPPKTFFRAGWAEDVTRQRTIQLNSLIHKILSSENQDMHCALYQFLEIFQKFSQQGLIENEKKAYEPDTFFSDEDLIEKINKLKGQPANSLGIIRQIKYCLFERKKRISYEIAKQFLLGFSNNEGFISLIMKNPNQIIVLEGLQMLVDLLSPQTNKDCEVFTKVLSRCTSSQLILTKYDPSFPHCIFRVTYFQFLRLYRQARGQDAVRDVMTNYQNEKELQRQYASWQKLQRLQGRG